MRRLNIVTLTALGLLCLGVGLLTRNAVGQTAKDLVGTWTWASVELMRADGTKTQPFGANPKGMVIFDSNGHFAYLLSRPDRAKFAANNREQGTAEENKAAMLGTLAYAGRYSVDDGGKTLVFHIEASSYPNSEGTDQKRSITVTGDELKWTNPAPTVAGGGTAHVVLKRVK
jgi:hypothetical protein